MLKIGQNWGKIANYPPQCSTKICTPGPHGQHIRYCTARCTTSIIQHESFLTKIVQNLEEQGKSFPNLTGDSLVKIFDHPA